MTHEVAYLACPYTHSDKEVERQRFHAVTFVAYQMIDEGKLVYSPLTHNIPIDALGFDGSWQDWSHFDHAMVARCDKLLVLKLPGWEESKGVAAEIACANKHGIPIEHLDPPHSLDLNSLPGQESISAQQERWRALIEERGWEPWQSPKNLVMSLCSEMGELAEIFRWLSEEESEELEEGASQAAKEEIGDLFNGLIWLAYRLKIDPMQAAREKLQQVAEKYPVEASRNWRKKWRRDFPA